MTYHSRRLQEKTGAREGDMHGSLPRARPFSLASTTSKPLLRSLNLSLTHVFKKIETTMR